MLTWLIPTIATVGLGLLGLWYMRRRDVVAADRAVLDSIWSEFAEYHRQIQVLQSAARSGWPNQRVLASDLADTWTALENGAAHFGRLSQLRYDGLGALAQRIHDACKSTANDRATLRGVAEGTATTSSSVLQGSVPWSELDSDALVYSALAAIYLREGPLTPRRRAWWRLPGRRDATDWQITAPIRNRIKRTRDQTGDRVTTIEQVRRIIRSYLKGPLCVLLTPNVF